MTSKRKNHPAQSTRRQSPTHASPTQNGGDYYNIPLNQLRPQQHGSIIGPPDLSEVQKAMTKYNGYEYQLIPVEIEKDAEIGLVLGQIEGEQWVFVDEILPNGMIDMHGIIKEGDYLIQAGVYSLVNVDMATALVLVRNAYDDGRKTISFVAARQQKPDLAQNQKNNLTTKNQKPAYERDRKASRAQSFVEYENDEEEDADEEVVPVKQRHSKHQMETDNTQF